MICHSTIRTFDGDAVTALHTAVFPEYAPGLRFVAVVVLDKGTGHYAATALGPAITIAWVPREVVSEERSSPAQIDAALASPDHVPLVVVPAQTLTYGFFSDHGSSFPVVSVKGTPMALVIRLEAIARDTHGQITLGWQPLAGQTRTNRS